MIRIIIRIMSVIIMLGLTGCAANDVIDTTQQPNSPQTPSSDTQKTPPPPDDPSPNAFPPSFMVDDVLYIDTGIIILLEIDESESLGRITSVGDLYSRPTENGQANIEVYDAPYVAYTLKYARYPGMRLEGLALLIAGNWTYFEPSE